jgi:hypothetical protein
MVVVIAQPKEGLNMASCTRRKNQTAKVDTVAQPIEHLSIMSEGGFRRDILHWE